LIKNNTFEWLIYMVINKKRKIGYALGGGMAYGLFHIGVLNVLEENDVYPDIIAGTSMGAIIGALYASGLSVVEIKEIASDLNWKKLVGLNDITLPINGIKGKKIVSLLKPVLKDVTFSQLKRRFACVATDLMTGEQVVLQKGPVIEALRASISLPAIFSPKNIKGRYLIDGGLSNVVPVSVCRDMGADFVFGVNTIPRPAENLSIMETCETYYDYQLQNTGSNRGSSSSGELPVIPKSRAREIKACIKNFFLDKLPKGRQQVIKAWDSVVNNKNVILLSKEPNMSYVLSQTLSLVEFRLAVDNLKDADVAISPFNGNIGFWQFNKIEEAIKAGEISTRLALQRDDLAQIILEHHRATVS
jgi:predicted acylesterase/phospholipase RssA